jgi:hypothetical protein
MRVAVIGGGFIGAEIAAALAMNGRDVVMAFPGKEIGDRVFPAPLAKFVSEYYRMKGVEVLSGQEAIGLDTRGGRPVLKTSAHRELLVDGVVAGIGIEPNVELAETCGLKVDNGIVVDEFLRTAGRNMAGASEPYTHLPFFYSDMFELGYEAVGELDPRLETFADWTRPNEEGVIYYLQDDRVRGVLLWNVWDQVGAARELIAAPGPFTEENLRGRLPAPAAMPTPGETKHSAGRAWIQRKGLASQIGASRWTQSLKGRGLM